MAVVKTRETLMTNIDVTNFVTKAVITPPKKNAPALWEGLFFGCFSCGNLPRVFTIGQCQNRQE